MLGIKDQVMHSDKLSQKHLDTLVNEIKNKQVELDIEAKRLRNSNELTNSNKYNYDFWCANAVGNALVRLRIFTENNFNYIESMSLISVSRYILELSIWLELFELDSKYGLVYYYQLIGNQKNHWTEYKRQIEREILLLNSFQKEESELTKKEMERILSISNEDEQIKAYESMSQNVMKTIDDKASRKFSIYAEQAKINGYAFQASIVEKNAKTRVEKSLQSIIDEESQFKANVPANIQNFIPKRWNWREMATKVGMDDDYAFIYSFSSKLLHATPSSITTEHKSLEISEMVIFLKYILVKINDNLDLAKKY